MMTKLVCLLGLTAFAAAVTAHMVWLAVSRGPGAYEAWWFIVGMGLGIGLTVCAANLIELLFPVRRR